MSKFDKLLLKLLSGTSDNNIGFEELRLLLLTLGFQERLTGGSHRIFTKENVIEIINIQPNGSKAKVYQVKQIRTLILKYKLSKMKSKYEIIIYWSDEDEAYLAEVPELPGCMADGKSYTEAVQNMEIIIQEWINTATELNREIPTPKGKLMYA